MAESIVNTQVTVTLILSLNEAKILKGLVQNPFINIDNIDDEPKDFKQFRQSIWDALVDIKTY